MFCILPESECILFSIVICMKIILKYLKTSLRCNFIINYLVNYSTDYSSYIVHVSSPQLRFNEDIDQLSVC